MAAPYVVVVEDDQDLRRMMESILTKAGFEVESTADADVAFERCRERTPSLIITDLMMPGVDGASLIRRLQRWFAENTPPVIIASASHSRFEVGKEHNAKVLPKPFRMADLLHLANTLISAEDPQSAESNQHDESQ